MASQFNKKIFVVHDFNIKLSMYNLTKKFQMEVNKTLKNNIIFISLNDSENINILKKEVSIYWGNRLSDQSLEKFFNHSQSP